jgi:hypothetical protein
VQQQAEQPADAAERLIPPASLTQYPRALTLRARRRSWNELPVRIWVILTVAVALITVYFTITKYLSGRYERWLITQGTPVQAELFRVQGTRDSSQAFNLTDRLQVYLNYEVPGHGKFTEVPGWLAQLPDQTPTPRVRPGEMRAIRIDPDDPKSWTDRTEPRPWLAEFTIVLLLLPLLAVLGLIAAWRRTQVLNIWRNGEVAAGVVVDLKQSSIAPFSRIVRFALADADDRRVFSTLHPAKGIPARGDVMWVIYPPNKPGRAVVASLYE